MGDECVNCVEPIIRVFTSVVSMGLITTLITRGGISDVLDNVRSLWRSAVVSMDSIVTAAETEECQRGTVGIQVSRTCVQTSEDATHRNSFECDV